MAAAENGNPPPPDIVVSCGEAGKLQKTQANKALDDVSTAWLSYPPHGSPKQETSNKKDVADRLGLCIDETESQMEEAVSWRLAAFRRLSQDFSKRAPKLVRFKSQVTERVIPMFHDDLSGSATADEDSSGFENQQLGEVKDATVVFVQERKPVNEELWGSVEAQANLEAAREYDVNARGDLGLKQAAQAVMDMHESSRNEGQLCDAMTQLQSVMDNGNLLFCFRIK